MDIDSFLKTIDINKISDKNERLGYIMARERLFVNKNGVTTPIEKLSEEIISDQLFKLTEKSFISVEDYLANAKDNTFVKCRPNIWVDIFNEELRRRYE